MKKHRLKILSLAFLCLFFTALLIQPTGPMADAGPSQAQSAEGLEVRAITVVPRLSAYGQAKPSQIWTAVAQADSRLMWVSPKLTNGEAVDRDEELLRIVDDRSSPEAASEGLAVTVIRAPFKGLAAGYDLKEGQTISAGSRLLTLESQERSEITIGFSGDKLAMLTSSSNSESRAAEVRDSLSQAWVEVADGQADRRLPARLSSRPVSVSPAGLVEAALIVDNLSSSEALHQVFISAPPQNGQVVIPRKAVFDGQIFVADENMRLRKRPVKVKYTLNNYAVISEGLKPGETIVTGEANLLKLGGQLDLRLNENFYKTAQSELGPSRRAEDNQSSPWHTAAGELAG